MLHSTPANAPVPTDPPAIVDRLRPIAAAIAWLVGCTIVVFAVFFTAIGGRWTSSTTPITVTPQSMSISRGAGQIANGRWVITGLDASGAAILSFSLPAVPAAEFPSLVWDIDGGEGATLTLVWRSDREPGKVQSRRLAWTQDQVRIPLADDPQWLGRIGGIALLVQGSVASPLRVGNATLEPLSLRYTLSDLLGEWLTFEPWRQRSINFVHGGNGAPLIWLPLAAASVLGAAALGFALWQRRRRVPIRPAVLWLMLAIAWTTVDLRWIANAARRTALTVETFAGRSDADRPLLAEDGVVAAFVARVRPVVAAEAGRVFVFSDVPYYRGRLAYHLLPINVYQDIRAEKPPPGTTFRSGDVLVLFQQRGIGFSAAESRVRWPDGQPIDVQPLLLGGGNAVFRVR